MGTYALKTLPHSSGLAAILLAAWICGGIAAAAERADDAVAARRSGLVQDVILHSGDVLAGQTASSASASMQSSIVTLSQQGKLLAQIEPDPQGRFAIRGLRPGVYELTRHDERQLVRLWQNDQAPRGAKLIATLSAVEPQETIRGQSPAGNCCPRVQPSDLLLWGTIGGVGLALPLAVAEPASN